MDTTPKYIKMCEEAKEIQALRFHEETKEGNRCFSYNFEDGDYFATDEDIEILGTTVYNPYLIHDKENHRIEISQVGWDEGAGYSTKKIVWIPTQAQLQKIAFSLCVEQGICGSPSESYQYIWSLHEFMLDHPEISGAGRGKGRCDWYPSHEVSLEQWWLMLIMEKKYGKHWDNKKEEWIKK